MEEALRTFLLATSAIATQVGQKIDWNESPQGATGRRIVLHLISAPPSMNLAGWDGWHIARVQVDCWGDTHKQARDVASAVEAVCRGLRTQLGGVKYRIFVIDSDGGKDTTGASTQHRSRVDLRVHFQA